MSDEPRRVFAETFGYFWLPCPRCQRMFGGFETGKGSIPNPGSDGGGRICCRECDKDWDSTTRSFKRPYTPEDDEEADLVRRLELLRSRRKLAVQQRLDDLAKEFFGYPHNFLTEREKRAIDRIIELEDGK